MTRTGLIDYVGLAGFRPDLNEKLLDLIHMLTDKKVRESLKGQALRIDWDEIARAMKGTDTWEMPKVIVPVQTEPASRFDDRTTQGAIDGYKASFERSIRDASGKDEFKSVIDKAAPVLVSPNAPLVVDTWPTAKDAPAPLARIREKLNVLIRDHSVSQTHGYHLKFEKLLDIVEQIIMNLENVPTFKSIPGIAPFPVMAPPAWPNSFPFSDPKTATITCKAQESQAKCQADGYSPSTVEDDSIPF